MLIMRKVENNVKSLTIYSPLETGSHCCGNVPQTSKFVCALMGKNRIVRMMLKKATTKNSKYGIMINGWCRQIYICH